MKILKDKKTLYLTLAVVGILLVAVAALWIQTHTASQKESTGKTAVIYQNGELIRRISLTDDKMETFSIESSDGGFNYIRIADGKIGISDADCPDRLCVKMGMISSAAYPISCLPHKLVIQIEDNEEEPPVDAITQ